MTTMTSQPRRQRAFVFLKFFPYWTAAASIMLLCLGDRLGVIRLIPAAPWGWGPAFYAHLVGFPSLVIFLYGCGPLWIHAHEPGSREPLWNRRADISTALVALGISWVYEFGQAYSAHVARGVPRDHVQWEQLAADALGIYVGFCILRKFLRKTLPGPAAG